MRDIKIVPLSIKYIDELLAFETENKAYFEQRCLPRPAAYFDRNLLQKVIENLVADVEVLMFLIFDREGLVGRLNVTEIQEEEGVGLTGVVGYRVGEAFGGRGIATKALSTLKNKLQAEGQFKRLYAGAAIDNYASQIVMLKNGFQFISRVENVGNMLGPGDIYVELFCDL